MGIYSVIPILSFMAYAGLMYITLQHKSRKTLHKIFILYMAGVTLWAVFAFLLCSDLFPEQYLLISRLLTVSAFFSAVAYYHFLRTFVNKPIRVQMSLVYGCFIAMSVLVFQNRLSYVVEPTPLGITIPTAESPGISANIVALFFMALVGYEIVGLFRIRWKSTDPLVRNRISYILAGFTLMATFGLAKLFPVLAKYPFAHLGNLGNAMLITFAIVKYRLLDMRIVARRGLVYTTTGLSAIGLYLILLFSLLRALHLNTSYVLTLTD